MRRNFAHVVNAADLYRLLGEEASQFWASVQRNCELWSAFAAREIRQAQDRWRISLGKEFSELLVNPPEEQEALRRYPMWEMANAIEQAERYFEQKRYAECEALVNVYKDHFNTSFPAHWYSRCRVLIAKLHQLKYQQGGKEEDLKLADAAFSNAEELYNVLDDRLASEQVRQTRQQLLSLSHPPQKETMSGAEPEEVTALRESPIKRGNDEPSGYTIWFQGPQPIRLGSDLLRGKGNQAASLVPPNAGEFYPARQSLLPALCAMSRHEILNWIGQQKFDELGAILLTRKEAAALRHGYYREED